MSDYAVSITEARNTISALFTSAVLGHRPAFLERQERMGLLIGEEDAEQLLERYEFHPEVFFEQNAVSFWLPELELYGRGQSYDDAEADLIEEVRDYIEEYWAEIDRYRLAPNRGGHLPYLLRALLADRKGRIATILFAPPTSVAAQESVALASA